MLKHILITTMATLFSWVAMSQNKQTIRGNVLDKLSQSTLPGVSVVVLKSDPLKAAVTDLDGKFKITEVL